MKKKFGLLLATLLVASTAAFTACNLTDGNSSLEESTTSSVTTSSPANSSSVAPATYTVTFNSDGGSDVASATVTDGEKATKPTDPTKTGYTFGGWYLGEAAFNFESVAITENVTLKAKWNVVTYTATVGKAGETGTPVQFTVENRAAKLAEIAAMLPEDTAQFDYEWTAALPTELALNNTQEFTYTETTKTYTLVLRLNNGQQDVEIPNVTYGTALASLIPSQQPEKVGHTLTGIKNGETDITENLATIVVEGNMTLDLVWTANEYTITFKNHDGSVLQTGTVTYGDPIMYTEDTPTKESTSQYSYTFSGWSPAYTSGMPCPVDGVEFTAQFNETEREYTVTFVNNDGTTVIDTQTVTYGAAATEPTTVPTYVGASIFVQEFDGWDKEITAVGDSGNQTYTAKYKAGAGAELATVSGLEARYWECMGANADGTTYVCGEGRQFGWNELNFVEGQNGLGLSNAIIAEAKKAGFNYLELKLRPTSWGNADLRPNGTTYSSTHEAYADMVAPGGDYVVVDLTNVSTTEGYTLLATCGNIVQVFGAKFVKQAITENVNYATAWYTYRDKYSDKYYAAYHGDFAKFRWNNEGGWDWTTPYMGTNTNRDGETTPYSTDAGGMAAALNGSSLTTNGWYFSKDEVQKALSLGFTKMKVSLIATGVDKIYYAEATAKDESSATSTVDVVDGKATFEITLADTSGIDWPWTALAYMMDSDGEGKMMLTGLYFSK